MHLWAEAAMAEHAAQGDRHTGILTEHTATNGSDDLMVDLVALSCWRPLQCSDALAGPFQATQESRIRGPSQ